MRTALFFYPLDATVIPHSVERSTLRRLHRRARKKREHRNEKRRGGRRGVLFARAPRKRFSSSLRSFFYANGAPAALFFVSYSHYFTFVRIDSSARARAPRERAFPLAVGQRRRRFLSPFIRSALFFFSRVRSPLVKVSRGKIKISRFDFKSGV